jgi:hypothetical protein
MKAIARPETVRRQRNAARPTVYETVLAEVRERVRESGKDLE